MLTNSQMHYYQPEPTVDTHRLDGLREVQTTPDLPCLKQVSFLMLSISHTPPHSFLAAAGQMLEVWSDKLQKTCPWSYCCLQESVTFLAVCHHILYFHCDGVKKPTNLEKGGYHCDFKRTMVLGWEVSLEDGALCMSRRNTVVNEQGSGWDFFIPETAAGEGEGRQQDSSSRHREHMLPPHTP